jgi:type IV secretion system protein VirB3
MAATPDDFSIPLRDPLFKGCTRPAMVMGVPIKPFFIGVAAVALLALWSGILLLGLLAFPVILTMRWITKQDDQQFRLLGHKMRMRLVHYNHNGRYWKASAYSPFAYKKRK